MPSERLIVGLDIGSVNIRAIAAELGKDNMLRVLHVSEAPSEGVRSGAVVNIETAMKVVQRVIEEIELETGREVAEVTAGIGGPHIEGVISEGVVGISRKDNEIHQDDVLRSLEVARSIDLPLDREIIHTLVQDYTIDGRSGVRDPIDMIGRRLETRVLMVTGEVTIGQTIKKCIGRAGYTNENLILQQIADSEAVLTQEEREVGTLLVNYGGGMCNLIGYRRGYPVYVGGVHIGGNEITSDLVYILNKPFDLVEKIKKEYGCCREELVESEDHVTIPPIGGWPSLRIPRRELAKIIEPRAAETFTLIKSVLQRKNMFDQVSAGIVFTGGSSLMPGVKELASEIFQAPVRVGMPRRIEGLDEQYVTPQYSTALGLVQYAGRQRIESRKPAKEQRPETKKGVFRRMKNFFEVLF